MALGREEGSLTTALVAAAAASAMVPALAAALWLWTHDPGEAREAERTMRANAEAEALAGALARWMDARLEELAAWGETPALVEGVRGAAVEHHERGYTEQPPAEVNAQLVHKRNLGLAPEADEYIATQVERSKTWHQVHYTDEYGFSVGSTEIEEDFVQTDEPWWRQAWGEGHFEGDAQLDPQVGVLGIRVAQRIDDPATGGAVGVIEGLIGLRAVQEFADTLAHERAADVRIIDAGGQLIAETTSGHARDRVLHISRSSSGEESWTTGVGSSGASGARLDGMRSIGWARISEGRGPHQGWIVVVEHAGGETEAAFARERTLAKTAAGVMLALGALCAGLGAAWTHVQITRRARALEDAARRVSAGEAAREVQIAGNDEIARIAESVERLRTSLRQAARALRAAKQGGRGA